MTQDERNAMTQDEWDAMTPAQRDAIRDLSGLSPQLLGLEGKRVEVTVRGERYRFIVGRSTGWRPCHIERKTRRSYGGFAASLRYDTVKVVS